MTTKAPRIHYAWWIMIGCCFLQAGALGLVLNSSGVFFVPVCNDLGFSQGGIAAYLTCYSWATCVGMLLVARLFPRMDVRLTMSVSAALIVVALGAMSFYTELWQWYLSGVVFGLAGSFIFVVPAPVLIGNWFQKRTGLATGIAMAFSGIGAAVFSPMLTWLIGLFGWRTTYFLAAVIMAVLVLPWTLFVFRFSPEKMGMRPYGYSEDGQESATRAAATSAGVPLRRALPTLAFVLLFLFAGLTSFYAGYNNQFPNFAVSIGETAMFGATLISAAMLGNIFSKLVMGFLTDVIGVFAAAIIPLLMIAVAMVAFLFFQNPAALYVAAFVYGFQNSLVSVSTPMLIKEVFGPKNYTEIFAFVRLGTGIIGGVGLSIVAISFDAFGSYDVAFIGGVALSLLAAACVWAVMLARKRLRWED